MGKAFDSVALMRELRDRLSQEMAEMTPAERIRHIHEKAGATALGARLQESAGETTSNSGASRTSAPQ